MRLTPTEYHVLEVLVRDAQGSSRSSSSSRRCGARARHETHYLRVYLAQLRRKLEPTTASRGHLITEPGVGYRLDLLPTAGRRTGEKVT